MSEVVQVRCEVCGAEWDPRLRLLGPLGCPNGLAHPEAHRLQARLQVVEAERDAAVALVRTLSAVLAGQG